MTPAWLEEAADRLWRGLGGSPHEFPRDLEADIALLLPMAVSAVPGLTPRVIDEWVAARGGAVRLPCSNRRLRGCIAARRGVGMAFLDAEDPPDERRFTLAHEISHFVLDYLLPRERALAIMGDAIRPVLDGERSPTTAERIDSILAGAPLGLYVNLLEREMDGRIERALTLRAESRADQLALHLLAPDDAVLSLLQPALRAADRLFSERAAVALLLERFGLPTGVAECAGRRLALQLCRPSARDWL